MASLHRWECLGNQVIDNPPDMCKVEITTQASLDIQSTFVVVRDVLCSCMLHRNPLAILIVIVLCENHISNRDMKPYAPCGIPLRQHGAPCFFSIALSCLNVYSQLRLYVVNRRICTCVSQSLQILLPLCHCCFVFDTHV